MAQVAMDPDLLVESLVDTLADHEPSGSGFALHEPSATDTGLWHLNVACLGCSS